jgi:hypothetical protein
MNSELLLLKLEQDDEVNEKAIRRFLNLEEFGLTRSNVGEDKDYARTYHVFKDRLRLPTSYVEMMCDSVYMKHFYSEKEIDAIGSRWHGRSAGKESPPTLHEGLNSASLRKVVST